MKGAFSTLGVYFNWDSYYLKCLCTPKCVSGLLLRVAVVGNVNVRVNTIYKTDI